MTVAQIVFIILLAAFGVAAWYAGFWAEMANWEPHTWMICIFWVLVAWIGRNEFGSK